MQHQRVRNDLVGQWIQSDPSRRGTTLLDVVYVNPLDRVHPVRAGRRELRWRVILAVDILETGAVRQLGDLHLEVRLHANRSVLFRIEHHGVALPAGAASTVVEVEARQILQHLVQRLLLVLVALPQP